MKVRITAARPAGGQVNKPITPKKAIGNRVELPDAVVEVWNQLIEKNLRGSSATVTQNEAASALAKQLKVTRQHVFDAGWLECEPMFRKAGWKVKYDKPGYNEDYSAYFEFSA